ncbi:hypothetical protein HDV06_001675 [Boothiomyces sp. JEL0866]|nr:hypothetical protein HDV06_001675 [Boothiomyces sp. JEL0866]
MAKFGEIKNEYFIIAKYLNLFELLELISSIKCDLDFNSHVNLMYFQESIFDYFKCDIQGPRDSKPYFTEFKEFTVFLYNTGSIVESILKIKLLISMRPYMRFNQFNAKQFLVENSINHLRSSDFNHKRNFQYLLIQSIIVKGDLHTLESFLKSNLALDYNTAFVLSIKFNRTKLAKLLLGDPRVDPCCFNNRGIELACRNDIELVQLLLNDKRTFSKFALVAAAYRGKLDIVELLLLDERFQPTNRALRDAVTMGHLDIVKLLIQKGLDPSVDENLNIQRASQNGHFNVVEYLLDDSRVDPSAKDNQAIRQAARRGYLDIVQLLLRDKRVTIKARNYEGIIQAAISGHFEITDYFAGGNIILERSTLFEKIAILCACVHKSNVDFANKLCPLLKNCDSIGYPFISRLHSALVKSAKMGYTDIVKFILLETKITPGYNSLISAIRSGNYDIVDLLLDFAVDPSLSQNEPIREASSRGFSKIVALLLSQPLVDPNRAPYKKETALTLAVVNGHVDTVKILLDSPRVDPSVNESMAFREAAKKDCLQIIELLLDNGKSNFSAKQNEAFRSAVVVGNPQIVRLLLNEKSISPSAERNFAIKHAAQMGYYEIVEMLLKDGRVDHQCDDNHPLWRAEMHGQTKVAQLLRSFKK